MQRKDLTKKRTKFILDDYGRLYAYEQLQEAFDMDF